MGRRKKKKRRAQPETGEGAPSAPPAPERINRPFAEALSEIRLDEPKGKGDPSKGTAPAAPRRDRSASRPSPSRPAEPPEPEGAEHRYEDRVAFAQAFSDVRPLAPRKQRGDPVADPHVRRRPVEGRGSPARAPRNEGAEVRARARLDALVAGGARFKVARDGSWIEGVREGAPPDAVRALGRKGWAPEASLDLHGMTGDEAEHAVGRFVRERHRWGDRRLLVVHGKGRHSEDGVGVLGDRAVHALTEGHAAPMVQAFRTAPHRLGGDGALLVQLVAK